MTNQPGEQKGATGPSERAKLCERTIAKWAKRTGVSRASGQVDSRPDTSTKSNGLNEV
ncbi:MAG: hypothetical protein PHR96_04295 [Clostridia bacterium]|nr:hypothetical protein [Clostridia bacterium]